MSDATSERWTMQDMFDCYVHFPCDFCGAKLIPGRLAKVAFGMCAEAAWCKWVGGTFSCPDCFDKGREAACLSETIAEFTAQIIMLFKQSNGPSGPQIDWWYSHKQEIIE